MSVIPIAMLRQMQSLPLSQKIIKTQLRIREFYEHFDGNVTVSFSGGKDSTVLLHLVRSIYPNVPAVFSDTGLEYPEIRQFVKTIDNVTTVRPKMSFKQVVKTHGYPVVSKKIAKKIEECQRPTPQNERTRSGACYGFLINGVQRQPPIPKKWQYLIDSPFKISWKCCNVMKKEPMQRYEKESHSHTYLGMMASDSNLRETIYLKKGCNVYDGKHIHSSPMSFWMEQDVWDYIHINHLPYSKIYDMGTDRTGCFACMFGIHLEKYPNRFQRMKTTHPKLWHYCCYELGCKEILDYMKIPVE